MNLRTIIMSAVIAGVVYLAGYFTAELSSSDPYCPTEDSCIVDYQHGHWTITEVTP